MSPKNYRHVQVLEETYDIIKNVAKDQNTTMIDIMAQMADQFNPKIPPTKQAITGVIKEFFENELRNYFKETKAEGSEPPYGLILYVDSTLDEDKENEAAGTLARKIIDAL